MLQALDQRFPVRRGILSSASPSVSPSCHATRCAKKRKNLQSGVGTLSVRLPTNRIAGSRFLLFPAIPRYYVCGRSLDRGIACAADGEVRPRSMRPILRSGREVTIGYIPGGGMSRTSVCLLLLGLAFCLLLQSSLPLFFPLNLLNDFMQGDVGGALVRFKAYSMI